MKMRREVLKLLILLCSVFTTTVGLGQTTYTWTGAGDGTNLATPGNWTTNGSTPAVTLPNGTYLDTAQWDGVTTTNLIITYGTVSLPGTGFGTFGINLVLTANQTNSVQIISAATPSAAIGLFGINIASGAGAFTLGNNTPNNLLLMGRPAGAVHHFVNNSTNPVTLNPSIEWEAGGGNGYTYDFGGTGNWIVNTYLMPLDGAFSVSPIMVDGPGTVFWSAGKTGVYNPNAPLGPVTINGGALVIKSAGLFTGTANQAITNNAIFVFDAASQSQTLNGIISGPGQLIVSNGTLMLAGTNTYTGNIFLSGGELIVASAENPGTSGPLGVTNTISSNGGTLGFSVNNTFDYSSRFSTAAGQAYSIDTAGQSVTFATGLGSSGATLTKLGAGTLTLTGTSSYGGTTTVSGGKLVFQGSKTGSGNIAVADGAALGVTENGSQITPATLTVGTSSGATLEFNNVFSTTTAPLAVGTLSLAGTVTININSGTLAPGYCYPLLTWTNGSARPVSLGILNGAVGDLSISGNTLLLCVTSVALVWTGVNSGNWTDPNNWTQTGIPITYFDPSPAVFDDTASGTTTVIVDAPVQPKSVTVNNSSKSYSITSSGGNNIAGTGSLTKSGTATLTLSGGANTYTGITTINRGTVSVGALANGGSASDIGAASSSAGNLVLDGGTLQYAGSGASSDHLFTLTTANGTIDASGFGALVFNNTGSPGYAGNGPRTLTLTGSDMDDNALAASLSDSPAGGATSLTKSGAGKWILTGTNTYSGGTTNANGTLQIGAGGASGSLGSGAVVNNTALVFNRTGTLTVSGAISGIGRVTNNGTGTVTLAGDNNYTGGTTINAGTLQIGSGGATGKLDSGSPVVNNGTLIFNSTTPMTLAGFNAVISGTGNLAKRGTGLLQLLGANTYAGGTLVDVGAQLQVCRGIDGSLASPVITNNGTLLMARQDFGVFHYSGNIVGVGKLVKDVNNPNPGDVTLTGTNIYFGGTFIGGGSIILGDGTNAGGSIIGNVMFTNSLVIDAYRSLVFNRPDNVTFSGNIIGGVTNPPALANMGQVVQNGSGTLTLTGSNTYPAGTIISNGTLQVGNGGASGSLGTGDAAVYGALVFNRADSATFTGGITGTGAVVQAGAGMLTLTGANTCTGPLIASNGTLAATSAGGDLDVSGGTVTPAGVGSISTLTVAGAMNISAGTVLASLNDALSPSNSFFSVTGAINYTGGTLKLVNFGPTLTVGDTFTIFNQAIPVGAGVTIVSPGGYTFANHLAVDGTVTVTSVAPPGPEAIMATRSGGNLNLSWPAAWTGMRLQCQTNTLRQGLSGSRPWFYIPGTDLSNNYTTGLMIQSNTCVFYRLVP